MKERYKILYKGGEGEITEKKSRFIATVRPVETEEEAAPNISEMKKRYCESADALQRRRGAGADGGPADAGRASGRGGV